MRPNSIRDQNHSINSLGVSSREQLSHQSALGNPEDVASLETCCVHHCAMSAMRSSNDGTRSQRSESPISA